MAMNKKPMRRFSNLPRFRHRDVLSGSGLLEIILCRLGWALQAAVLAGIAAVNSPAEIVFQDFFAEPAGNVTSSVPWIDVEGNGWQSGAGPSGLAMDGNGHLLNAAVNAAAATGVELVPIGPHGSMTASAWMQLPVGSTESIDMGFANSNQFLTASQRQRSMDPSVRHRSRHALRRRRA